MDFRCSWGYARKVRRQNGLLVFLYQLTDKMDPAVRQRPAAIANRQLKSGLPSSFSSSEIERVEEEKIRIEGREEGIAFLRP
jgi:hypothetical protein